MSPKERRKTLVIANWKANPDSAKEAREIFAGVKKIAGKFRNLEIVICPSYVHLAELKKARGASSLALGAQDFFFEPRGAFTGEVGYEALLDTNIKYAILGHSERRAAGEDNEIISKKVLAAIANRVLPILCVGEPTRDENLGYLSFLKGQLVDAFYKVPKSKVTSVVIAYEPVWAIGKSAKRNATSAEIKEIVIFIKRVIGDLYKTKSVPPIKIIYGGSVNAKDAAEILSEGGVDGLLVGHASLNAKTFGEILKIADETKR